MVFVVFEGSSLSCSRSGYVSFSQIFPKRGRFLRSRSLFWIFLFIVMIVIIFFFFHVHHRRLYSFFPSSLFASLPFLLLFLAWLVLFLLLFLFSFPTFLALFVVFPAVFLVVFVVSLGVLFLVVFLCFDFYLGHCLVLVVLYVYLYLVLFPLCLCSMLAVFLFVLIGLFRVFSFLSRLCFGLRLRLGQCVFLILPDLLFSYTVVILISSFSDSDCN